MTFFELANFLNDPPVHLIPVFISTLGLIPKILLILKIRYVLVIMLHLILARVICDVLRPREVSRQAI